MRTWTDTDDPNDPCPYCVSWVGVRPDVDGSPDDPIDLIPYGPDATGELVIVDRMYRQAHPECQAAIDAYLKERDAENRRQGIQ